MNQNGSFPFHPHGDSSSNSSSSSSNNNNNNNNNSDETPAQIEHPHAHDVLSGRGGLANHHPGNNWFRQLVRSKRELYHHASNAKRRLIARSIVHDVQTRIPAGRFLCKDESSLLWKQITDKEAVDKTLRAFRDMGFDHDKKQKKKVPVLPKLTLKNRVSSLFRHFINPPEPSTITPPPYNFDCRTNNSLFNWIRPFHSVNTENDHVPPSPRPVPPPLPHPPLEESESSINPELAAEMSKYLDCYIAQGEDDGLLSMSEPQPNPTNRVVEHVDTDSGTSLPDRSNGMRQDLDHSTNVHDVHQPSISLDMDCGTFAAEHGPLHDSNPAMSHRNGAVTVTVVVTPPSGVGDNHSVEICLGRQTSASLLADFADD